MININYDTCIQCENCVKICPASIFFTENGKIVLRNEDGCIVCGHCVGVCPTDSVVHSDFPKSKIHKINRAELPSPDQLMLLISSRRSNRAMGKKEVPEDKLQMILEAAHRAPTAENKQLINFTVIKGNEKVHAISQYTIDTFSRIQKILSNPIVKPIIKPFMRDTFKMIPVFDHLKSEFAKGNDGIMRGATTIIFITTKKSNRFGKEDANLAYQNASLMAESLGVAHFYMGFVLAAANIDKGVKLGKILDIDERVCAAMALGMPEVTFKNYIDRKDINISTR
ncbi:MAG: nitroreductase family protein [Bacteroidales bacterium]